MAGKINYNNIDWEDYDYEAEERASLDGRKRGNNRVRPMKQDATRSAEAKAKSKATRYTDEQIMAKKEANAKIAAKKAEDNKKAFAAKRREDSGLDKKACSFKNNRDNNYRGRR